MPTKALPDETVGKARLRIVMDGPVYRGVVLRDGKKGEVIEHTDLDHLRHRLREEAGKTDPAFWGFDGAIARFLSFNKLGFADPNYAERERAYKVDACELLASLLPLDQAIAATPEQAASLSKVVSKTNLLAHQHEQQHMKAVLTGNMGAALVQASAELAQGKTEQALRKMTRIGEKVGRVSWPIATYLPFLWDRDNQMFSKPEVTQDFARRVGHPFAQQYEGDLSATVYDSLLDLAAQTQRAIASLKPQDRIDVQGFIWVVGKYLDDDFHRGKADEPASGAKGG